MPPVRKEEDSAGDNQYANKSRKKLEEGCAKIFPHRVKILSHTSAFSTEA